ncbi:NTP transferase domain-containing protein [Aurantiacibacter sediminis]|uniref:NTP transferase domain-containing protein n=1 Tax=Aurantiacibacter sediminis TaxID=2793064 RepID=A0ABS0N4W4_9SPHN|nr:NTP transferase domain-containing protein [Aurantiacibacter sediminis]MBH5322754.1 NTP transferase domain-containing protein [Aurantiacibacter sediminis]
MSQTPVTVIVLAAQRTGVTNPLAARAGVSHKALVPICGRPLIEHVMEVLTSSAGVSDIRVVLEPEGQQIVDPALETFRPRGIPITLHNSDANIVESVLGAIQGEDRPFIVTTADNVLLTKQGLDQARTTLLQSDGIITLTTRERVWAVHPQGQRGFYDFKDAGYASCNLFGLNGQKSLRAAEVFREGGQFMSNKGRMIRAFGLFNIILMGLKLISLPRGLQRISKRFGLDIRPVIYEDGSLAIDVDNERTFIIAEWILGQRLGMDIPKPEIPADMK